MTSIYVIGSLRNPLIPEIGNALREIGLEAFDDWFAAGPEADDSWKTYEQGRGSTYSGALMGYAAKHVFDFDKFHLDRVDSGLLVLPGGRSAHLELGYMIGRGKPGYVLMDTPDRWDVMYRFCERVFFSKEEMVEYFKH